MYNANPIGKLVLLGKIKINVNLARQHQKTILTPLPTHLHMSRMKMIH